MKNTRFALLAALACLTASTRAATLPGHMGDESMIETESMPRVSIGASADIIQRDVRIGDSTDGQLDAYAFSAYLGYDALRWLTLYGTAGANFLDSLGGAVASGEFDAGARWSLGLNASLWHIETGDFDFLRGRFAIGFAAEYGQNNAAGDPEDVSWTEIALSLPLSYEIPNIPMEYLGVESLVLYAGPLYSTLDGEVEGTSALDFESHEEAGVMAGADIYTAHNLSIGARLHYVNGTSVNAAARYHF